MTAPKDVVRLAALGDVHYPKNPPETLRPLFAHINQQADVLLLCGDLTDYGRLEEAHGLAHSLTAEVRIPILGVLGNHDFESNAHDEVEKILREAGVIILDGDMCEVHGIGFAGVKGFAGGFGQYALQPWGETAIKHFVHEAVNEALKLESALAKLHTPQRIALLHYAPIQATVQGEPSELFPFLGSSRLEEPLNRYEVTAVFHGHAHQGSPEGHTTAGIPVYNVAMSLLQKAFPDQPPCRIVDIPVAPPAGSRVEA
jgi:Icc-related predicted phosphoesterase